MATRAPARNQDTNQMIAMKAYERFVSRGGEHGHDLDDWLAAESEVNGDRPKRVVATPRAAGRSRPSRSK